LVNGGSAVHTFIRKYADLVTGSLSGFDRLVLRGTLRSISYVDGMRIFLAGAGVLLKNFGKFVENATSCVKAASSAVASELGRPEIYLREWLSRQMDHRGLRYCRRGNAFTWIEHPERAQRLASAQLRVGWPKKIDDLIGDVCLAHDAIFGGRPPAYYWSVYQSEWAPGRRPRRHTRVETHAPGHRRFATARQGLAGCQRALPRCPRRHRHERAAR
jgi:hypothetical protein